MSRNLTPTLAAYAAGRSIAPLWVSPSGRAFYPIAGGSTDPMPDPAPSPDPAPDPKPDPEPEGKTFTQAELDRILTGRLSKFADYDALKTERDKLRDANATEQEKATAAARDEARKEAIAETAPRLVTAEFKAAAKGRMEPAALTALLEDLDLSKFLDDKGEVDVDRIEKKVDALAPEEAPAKPSLKGGVRKTAIKPEPTPGMGRLRSAYADPK